MYGILPGKSQAKLLLADIIECRFHRDLEVHARHVTLQTCTLSEHWTCLEKKNTRRDVRLKENTGVQQHPCTMKLIK